MLRMLSSRSEQGNAVHTVECNTAASTRLIPEDAQKIMRDAVFMGGKRAAIWVQDFSKADTEIEIRFAALTNSITSGEYWSFHRLVCVPRNPAPDTDEWIMMKDFYKIIYTEAEWAGVESRDFEGYLNQQGLARGPSA